MDAPETRWLERAARWLLLAGASWPALGAGQPSTSERASEAIELRLSPPRELHVGEHARLEVELLLPEQAAGPLLLTPFREGQALEVVKGRLLRGDARDPGARPLRFELPVLARAAGVARVGIRLLAYVCEGQGQKRCRAVQAETRADVMVLP